MSVIVASLVELLDTGCIIKICNNSTDSFSETFHLTHHKLDERRHLQTRSKAQKPFTQNAPTVFGWRLKIGQFVGFLLFKQLLDVVRYVVDWSQRHRT